MSHWIENENFLLERKRGKRGIPVSFYKGPNSSWAQYSDFPWPLCSLQCDLGGFRGHKMTRSTHDGLLDNTVGTAQSCKVSARASKSANIMMGCLLLCPVGCQNSANCFGLRCAKEVMAKYSTVGTIINYILITHRYEYIHTSSMFTGLKWLGSGEVYFEIFLNTNIYILKTTTCPSIFFKPFPIGRTITGSERSRGVPVQYMSGSCSTWGTHLIIIWSWGIARNIFCPILCCVFHFIILDFILGFDPLIQTSLWYRYLPWLTSCATSSSSPPYVFPPAASIM